MRVTSELEVRFKKSCAAFSSSTLFGVLETECATGRIPRLEGARFAPRGSAMERITERVCVLGAIVLVASFGAGCASTTTRMEPTVPTGPVTW